MDIRVAQFNKHKVEIKKMRLKDANILFPFVGSAMIKLNLGNFNFFNELKPSDIEMFQEKMCEYIFKTVESKNEDGSITRVKKNISLSDFEESIDEFLPLLSLFLEHNFSFFSKAQKILEPILTKESAS